MWTEVIVLAVWGVTAAAVFVRGGRVLARGAANRREFTSAVQNVTFGCWMVVMGCSLALVAGWGRPAFAIADPDVLSAAPLVTLIVVGLAAIGVTRFAVSRWDARQAAQDDYAEGPTGGPTRDEAPEHRGTGPR